MERKDRKTLTFLAATAVILAIIGFYLGLLDNGPQDLLR